MYRIARIRCSGIGPPDARYDRPAPDAPPFELCCLDADGEPADTLAWLENGGGKTVLLSLIFHVVRPDKAAQIGKDQKGKRGDISDFVLPGEVGHVVIEWQADDSDKTLITGLVVERRGASTPPRTWYVLSGRSDQLRIDDLVFDIDGRRVAPARYLESLERLAGGTTKTARRDRVELSRTNVQRTWIETLANHGLDPALFDYQVRMNRSEGGATDLFRFGSSEAFVEFFLELTLNPDTAASLGETLGRVADKVAALPRKELELAHAVGAVERLARLAEQWDNYQQLEAERVEARRGAERLDDALAAAETDAGARLEKAERAAEVAQTEQAEADRARRDADARARAIQIAAADARVAQLATILEIRTRAAKRAQLTMTAWTRVPQGVRVHGLAGRAEGLRQRLTEAESEAAPLREVADCHLRALRRAIAETRDKAEADLGAAQTDIDAGRDEQRDAQSRVDAALAEAGDAKGHQDELAKVVDSYNAALAQARREGLFDETETPTEALARVTSESEVTQAQQATASAEYSQLKAALPGYLERAESDRAKADRLEHEAAQAAKLVKDATAEREVLAAHALLDELGAGGSDLELVGSELAKRVAMEAARLRTAAVGSAAASAEDRRASASLETDRLLPPRADVEALCRVLHQSEVRSAVPGWRYLVEALPASRHSEVISAKPALVEGIIVAEGDLVTAQSVLSAAAPAAAVAVTTGAALTGPHRNEDEAWVVPPAAAMHDKSAAEDELAARLERLEDAGRHQQALSEAEAAARNLAERISVHLERWPAGRLPAAVAHRADLAAQAATARTDCARSSEALESHQAIVEERRTAAEKAGKRLEGALRQTAQLQPVAADETKARHATLELDQWDELKRRAEEQAEAARAEVTAAQAMVEEATQHKIRASGLRNNAEHDLAQLRDPGPGRASEPGPIETLRARHAEAEKAVSRATTESELARELHDVENQLSAERESFDALDAELRARVEELVSDPGAADHAYRRHAEHDASQASEAARGELNRADSNHRFAQEQRKGLPDPERPVDLGQLPQSLPELEALTRAAEQEADQARHARSEAEEHLTRVKTEASQLGATKKAIGTQRAALGAIVGQRTPGEATPFERDADEAVRQALAAVSQTAETAKKANEEWRTAAHQVGVFARQDTWAELSGDLTRRLANDPPEAIASESANLLAQTRILADRLKEDIEGLDTHRQLLITSLADAVSDAARSLRAARAKSVLPEGLGDWTGHPFLKIGLEVPSDRSELDARLRRFTNDLLQNAPKVGLPAGAALVCQALLACSEKEVDVQVLKPNKAQRLRYVPVHDMAELSGGMRATAAIAMFCTLARIRAGNRGRRAGVGTLILDNPIGDANATYLVSLQRLVAQMSDVQLLYTTGVNDMDAIRLFPVVTRLTNEAAKRSHLSYVVADEAFLKQLMPHDGDYSLVTGTRLVRRRPIQLTLDVSDGEDE